MKTESISSVYFGIKPQLKVSKKYRGLFHDVAGKFDKYTNERIKRKPNEITNYEIVQNKKGLIFTEYKDGWEHRIKFGKKLTKDFLEKPADYIAKTLTEAAEMFALDDKLWFRIANTVNGITKNRKLKMPNAEQGKFEDLILEKAYDKYILPAMENNLKKNVFLARAEIQI